MIHIQEYVSLKDFTYMNVGGLARFFVEVRTQEDVAETVMWARDRKVSITVLGAGSNVLVADEGYNGLVMRMHLEEISFGGDRPFFGAGVGMARAAHAALEHNRGGLEWAVGIPGTIGGSVYGNAGCFGGDMHTMIDTVLVFDSNRVTKYELRVAECNFDYRESVFKHNKNFIILGATLKLSHISDAEKKEKQQWIGRMMRERVHEQAIGEQTMGSTFKGISLTPNIFAALLKSDPAFQKGDKTCWVFENRAGRLSAGFIIERAGLKNYCQGKACISSKHANFFINNGNATANDVKELIAFVKEKIEKKFGIILEEEIQYIKT